MKDRKPQIVEVRHFLKGRDTHPDHSDRVCPSCVDIYQVHESGWPKDEQSQEAGGHEEKLRSWLSMDD